MVLGILNPAGKRSIPCGLSPVGRGQVVEPTFWTTTAPAVGAAFLASLVEFVEALTIVLAVGTVRGWRPALRGTAAGVALLVAPVAALAR